MDEKLEAMFIKLCDKLEPKEEIVVAPVVEEEVIEEEVLVEATVEPEEEVEMVMHTDLSKVPVFVPNKFDYQLSTEDNVKKNIRNFKFN